MTDGGELQLIYEFSRNYNLKTLNKCPLVCAKHHLKLSTEIIHTQLLMNRVVDSRVSHLFVIKIKNGPFSSCVLNIE